MTQDKDKSKDRDRDRGEDKEARCQSAKQKARTCSGKYAKYVDEKPKQVLKGERWRINYGEEGYPENLLFVKDPPQCLYGIGNKQALQDGLAIVGARRATPYGLAVAKKFSELAASRGITIVSGGAIGCDSQAHRGALLVGGITVAVLGGGCDQIYPQSNKRLFQEIIDSGGAVISEQYWSQPALPFQFRARNRIIAGLSRATLIAEAGLPSGTFSTADEALEAGREVLAVPGAITSPTSFGANRLIYQGATPVVDEDTFLDVLTTLFGTICLKNLPQEKKKQNDQLLKVLLAEPKRLEELYNLNLKPEGTYDKQTWILVHLTELERDGIIARFPDGRYGPARA